MTELTRRDLLGRGAAAAGALTLSGAPSARAASGAFDGTIRVLGLGYDLLDPIRRERSKDLGFQIVSRAEQHPHVIQHLVRQEPATFDVFSCFGQDMAEFWATGNLQPVADRQGSALEGHHAALQAREGAAWQRTLHVRPG